MAGNTYRFIATSWLPEDRENRVFILVAAATLFIALLLAVFVSLIEVPEKERKARTPVPERVAKFISEKEVQPTPPPVATPTPRPIPTPKPRVPRDPTRDREEPKILTESEKKAREKASESGLLALAGELADLIDTSEVDAMVGKKTQKAGNAANTAATLDNSSLTAGAGQGSGGVATGDYVAGIGQTNLDAREVALVKQSLLKKEKGPGSTSGESASRGRSGNVRTEEEVTIVFDQNKGQLYSIYNRERRKKPGLKGKIVLEITISPEGRVSAVKIKSSELNDPALERRLIARIKLFKFEAKAVEPVTVTFPIEFLPS